jgi:glycosyltransferase involved in cell wall biosynthesis
MFTLRLGEAMRADGGPSTLRVFCPQECELFRRCRESGIDVCHVAFPDINPPRHVYGILASIWRLRGLLERARDDVVVVGVGSATHAFLSAAALSLRRRPRVIHLMHEQDTAARRSARFLFRRFGTVVAVGENAARTYRERIGIPVGKVNIFLTAREYAAARDAAPPPVGESKPVLGVLTRIYPSKGLLELVDELAEIPDAWSELRVGGDYDDLAYVQRVRRRIAEHGLDGRVRFLGFEADPFAFIESIDVVVVPSVGTEGQPLVILEALACGRPSVVREPALPPEFEDLPVFPYRSVRDLEAVLSSLPAAPVEAPGLAERFGAAQVLDTLERAGA